MTDARQAPEAPDQVVADAAIGNWVDRYAPPAARPWLRLSRADRPVGTWLLLLPCWWAVFLSAASGDGLGWKGAWIILGSAIGAFLMRGAGCTWNDITDRDIDGDVARTASRPIPSGQVTLRGAVIWMCVQALLALGILLTFNWVAIGLGVASLALVCVYPFAKRFTWWPQIFLGLAFNWGALLVWAAHDGALGWPAGLLYLGGIAWTLFYDTIYAHQDREDDALIGVKSTARLFGENSPVWLGGFLALTMGLMTAAVDLAFDTGSSGRALALAGVAGMGLHMVWQLRSLDIHDGERCLRLFRSNRDAGLIVVLGFALATLI